MFENVSRAQLEIELLRAWDDIVGWQDQIEEANNIIEQLTEKVADLEADLRFMD